MRDRLIGIYVTMGVWEPGRSCWLRFSQPEPRSAALTLGPGVEELLLGRHVQLQSIAYDYRLMAFLPPTGREPGLAARPLLV